MSKANETAGLHGEPWAAGPNSSGVHIRCADRAWFQVESDVLPTVLQNRIRRAAACVNACTGIEDPAGAMNLLRQVAEESPAGTDSYEDPICWFCGVSSIAYTGQPAVPHAESCLWALIRKALGMAVPPAAEAGMTYEEAYGPSGDAPDAD